MCCMMIAVLTKKHNNSERAPTLLGFLDLAQRDRHQFVSGKLVNRQAVRDAPLRSLLLLLLLSCCVAKELADAALVEVTQRR